MRLLLFSVFVASAIADPTFSTTFFTKALHVISTNGTDPVVQIRDLICPINGDALCDGAQNCSETVVESEGYFTDCLIPTILSSSFHAGIPPIGKPGSELAKFLEFFVVLRKNFRNLIYKSDTRNSIRQEMFEFYRNDLPKIAEKAIQENSFDAVELAVSAKDLLGCTNKNESSLVSCYARVHIKLLFDQEVAKMREDAPAFEELAQILYDGDLAKVENLPIVIESLRKGIKQNRNINHRLQESFQQVKKLRKQRRISECNLRRYIRQIYLLLNINDNRYVDTQGRIDRLQCQSEENTIVATKQEEQECIWTHEQLINNGTLSVEEKLAEIQGSKWSANDTVHHVAFTYIIYNDNIYDEYHTSNEVANHQIEYKLAVWEELKRSCKENFILENGTEQGLSVFRESDFPDFNWTYPLRFIHDVEEMVKDRIFLDSEEGRHVREVLRIARNGGKATLRMERIRNEVHLHSPLDFSQEEYAYLRYIERLVLANVYKDTIKAQFGEETALGFLKEIELIFAGIYRRKRALLFDGRFNNVMIFVRHLHQRNELLEVLLPCLEKNLIKLGITSDILMKLKDTISGFDVQQLHTMLSAFEAAGVTCENAPPSTGVPRTTGYENTSPTYYTTGSSTRFQTSPYTTPERPTTEPEPFETSPHYRRSSSPSETTRYTTPERPTTEPEPIETSPHYRRSSLPSETTRYTTPERPTTEPEPFETSPHYPRSSTRFQTTPYTTTEGTTPSDQCTCPNQISIVAKIDFCQLNPKFSGVAQFENGRMRRSANDIQTAAAALAHEIFGLEGNDGKAIDENISLSV